MGELTGLTESIAELTEIGEALSSKASALPAAQAIAKQALSNYQQTDPDADESEFIAQETVDGAEVLVIEEQAEFIEFGTPTMAARPFLRPAVEQVNISEEIAKAIQSTLP